MRHTRPPYRTRIRWHRWMPWYELSRQVGEWQARNDEREGLPLAALGVALAALLLTLLAPAFAFPIVVLGGLLAAAQVACRGADGARLVAGLRAEGLPSPRTLLRLGVQAATEDARVLWHGRTARAAASLDTAALAAPAPVLLLEGEIVSGGTDDDGTDRPTTDWKEGEVDQ